MRKPLVIFAVVMMLVLCLASLPSSSAQNSSEVVIKTDLMLLGVQELKGGGHITFELYGEAATDLRQKVLAHYDGVGSGIPNGRIDPLELKDGTSESGGRYIADLEAVLDDISYFGATVRSVDPLHEGEGEDITIDAQGLVGENVTTSTSPIYLYFYLDAVQRTGTRGVDLLPEELFHALYKAIYKDTYDSSVHDWDGHVEYTHTDYRVSLSSFSGTTKAGDINVIRSPAGNIGLYSDSFDSMNPPTVSATYAKYSSFDFLECPQVLFVLLFITGYFVSTVPTRFYAEYKYSLPRRLRHKALKVTWLHAVTKVLLLVMLLFYFFPTIFVVLGLKLFVSGLLLWIMFISFAIVSFALSKYVYDKQKEDAPTLKEITPSRPKATTPKPAIKTTPTVKGVVPPPPPPGSSREKDSRPTCDMCSKKIDYSDLIKCKECGKFFHESCAAVKKVCTGCGATLVAETEPAKPVKEEKMVQCPTCGEVNKFLEGQDLVFLKCSSCGIVLERVSTGYNYLIIDNERSAVYELFISTLKQGANGMLISTVFPGKLEKEYDLEGTEMYWLSDTTTEGSTTLNPQRLDFEIMRGISNFLKNNPKPVLLLDALENLVVENGFDKVIKFIKKVNDLSSVNEGTLFVPVVPSALEADQVGMLKKEFDKVYDIIERKPVHDDASK